MTFTEYLLIGIVAFIAVSDTAIAIFKGLAFTYSARLLADARSFPIISFVAGLVVGHLWWTNC